MVKKNNKKSNLQRIIENSEKKIKKVSSEEKLAFSENATFLNESIDIEKDIIKKEKEDKAYDIFTYFWLSGLLALVPVSIYLISSGLNVNIGIFTGLLLGFWLLTFFTLLWVKVIKNFKKTFLAFTPLFLCIPSVFSFERFIVSPLVEGIIILLAVIISMELMFWFYDKEKPNETENVLLFTAKRKLINFLKSLIGVLPFLGVVNIIIDLETWLNKNYEVIRKAVEIALIIFVCSALLIMLVWAFLWLNSLKYRKKEVSENTKEFDYFSKRVEELKKEKEFEESKKNEEGEFQ